MPSTVVGVVLPTDSSISPRQSYVRAPSGVMGRFQTRERTATAFRCVSSICDQLSRSIKRQELSTERTSHLADSGDGDDDDDGVRFDRRWEVLDFFPLDSVPFLLYSWLLSKRTGIEMEEQMDRDRNMKISTRKLTRMFIRLIAAVSVLEESV